MHLANTALKCGLTKAIPKVSDTPRGVAEALLLPESGIYQWVFPCTTHSTGHSKHYCVYYVYYSIV